MIRFKQKEGKAILNISEDWNWVVSKKLESLKITSKHIIIELEHCRLMDSESIILLNKWIDKGYRIEMKQVPSIYFEIIQILNLEDRFSVIQIQY